MKPDLPLPELTTPAVSGGCAYEPNIIKNPRDYFGTWTPEGWKIHRIRFGATVTDTVALDGDGRTIDFEGLPLVDEPCTHDIADPSSDGGIYPAEPRVEYPPGRPRWAVSHTFLAYPVADQTLYQQEYTWTRSHLTTHFRRHVLLEEATTDAHDGKTLRVQHRPISSVIAGNKAYALCNSSVRGVWDNPRKSGANYYSRPQVKVCRSHNAVYVLVRESPVIQCHGIWKAAAGDEPAFDAKGNLSDSRLLQERGIPLDAPRLGAVGYALKKAPSSFYGNEVDVVDGNMVDIVPSMLASLQACRDVPFIEHSAGFAAQGRWDHEQDLCGIPGFYAASWDFNGNGIVDAEDEAVLTSALGRKVRPNYYSAAYFGNDWLSTGVLLNPEMRGGELLICAWDQGAGYDSEEGLIHLFETPGPSRRVFVEYHYDVPAEAGRENILLTIRHA